MVLLTGLIVCTPTTTLWQIWLLRPSVHFMNVKQNYVLCDGWLIRTLADHLVFPDLTSNLITQCISKWMANIQLANSTKVFPGIYFLDTYLKPMSLTISFHVKLALWVCAPFWNRPSSISTNLKPLTTLKAASLSWVAHHLTKFNQTITSFLTECLNQVTGGHHSRSWPRGPLESWRKRWETGWNWDFGVDIYMYIWYPDISSKYLMTSR